MKNLAPILIFLLALNGYSQTSTYNKGLKKNTLAFGEWYLNKGIETFVTKQNPVGYKQSYDEIKNLLAYYELNIMEPEIDESLIDDTVKSLNDFQNLSNSLSIEWSTINMAWRASDVYQINWICKSEINLIFIKKI